jgi:hypothetical protein
MDINVVQLLVGAAVSLVVGAASAWVAGTYGVRHGLERAQRERAFDRRLEWYEKAFRVLSRFRSPTVEFLIDIHRVAIREEGDKLLRETEK